MREKPVADDINNYNFDFAQEAEALRRELGALLDKTLFVNVDITGSDSLDAQAVLSQVIGDERLAAYNLSGIYTAITKTYSDDPGKSSTKYRMDLGDGAAAHAIVINNGNPYEGILGEENRSLLGLFFFYHETAHVLISGNKPEKEENDPFLECAADAYAALHLLQRFGRKAAPLLSMISWYRSYAVIAEQDTAHLSTTVLDRIIADSASHDFSRLTPVRMIELAEAYAKEGTPAPVMLSRARSVLRDAWEHTSPDEAHLILDAALRSKSELVRYIGAKYFAPFMQPQGVDFDGEKFRYSRQAQNHYRALIERRASINNMPKIARLLKAFNKRAPAKSLADYTKVAPAGRGPFTFNDCST